LSGVVYVVDDDDLVLRTLEGLLESFGYPSRCLSSATDLLARLPLEPASCVVTDMRMSGMNGLRLLEALRERGEPSPVILITGYADTDVAVSAFRRGAVDFLKKPFGNTEFIEAVEGALRRSETLSAEARRAGEARSRLAALSERELEIAKLLAQGRTNKVVARDLGISHRTVEHHRGNAMAKLGAASLVDLVYLLVLAGEVEPVRLGPPDGGR
jgi:two-component system response regulator FixJ